MTTKAIYDYLKTQNRPYSINDIGTNLQNQYGKSDIQKAVDKLVTTNKIFEKAYGKQKIYCPVQESTADVNELMRIDRELKSHANEIESKLQEIKKEASELEARLNSLRETPRLDEAIKIRDQLKRSIAELTQRLDDLMEANGSQDLGVEKGKAEKILNNYTREYSKRKRLCTQIIDCILEAYPGSKKDLHEEIGIEIKLV